MENKIERLESKHNFMFWFHVFITSLAWVGPFLFSWYLMLTAYAIILLQFLVFDKCLLNSKHELTDSEDATFYSYLFENAVKYSPDMPLININYRYDHHNFIFDISDNGLGVTPTEKKKVFEKFYRVGNEETRKTKGTGLGLYIVAQIIKAHRGTIQLLDNQPNGSTFHIVLPNP